MFPLVILAILGLLIALFMVTTRARNGAPSQRALHAWVLRPLTTLAFTWSQIASFCKSTCIEILTWPKRSEVDHTDETNSLLGVAIVRFLYLVISTSIFLSDIPLTFLRTTSLYHLLPTALHIPLDAFTAILWLLVPGVWGLLLMEAAGLLPRATRLFDPVPT